MCKKILNAIYYFIVTAVFTKLKMYGKRELPLQNVPMPTYMELSVKTDAEIIPYISWQSNSKCASTVVNAGFPVEGGDPAGGSWGGGGLLTCSVGAFQ